MFVPTTHHSFLISYSPATAQTGPYGGGIRAPNKEDVGELAHACGFELGGDDQVPFIRIDLDEQDPRLATLTKAILEKYHLKPSPWRVIPVAERQHYFGLQRKVTWSKKEIDACQWLRLIPNRVIATHVTPDDEQAQREEYVVEVDERQRSAVQLGHFMPFHAVAVAEPLRSAMLAAGLAGLHLLPVIFMPPERKVRKPLWALKSTVILPPALNPLVNDKGEVVAPNTEWWCWWDDGGRTPELLRYDRTAFEAVGPFDIAMTCERVSTSRKNSFRWCIVSQRFRAEMARLEVRGLDYVPVELQ